MYIIHVGDILSYIILFVHAAAIFGKYQISNNMVTPPHFEKIRTINNESILRDLNFAQCSAWMPNSNELEFHYPNIGPKWNIKKQ